MKTKLLLLVSLSVLLYGCGAEEVTSPLWGIDYSSETTSGLVSGSVDQFSSDQKTVYIAKAANLRCAGGSTFLLSYTFESGDNLELSIAKRTTDLNYYFSASEGENQLLMATLNGEPLNLTADSKLTVQPRSDENKFATLTKLHTTDLGVFDGAIGRVPLLK